MVFLTKLIKSVGVKKKQNEYMEIKRMRLEDLDWKLGPCAKFRRFWRRKFPLVLGGKRSKNVEEMTICEKFQIKVITPGTYENFVFKSIIGFVSGVLLTYLFFIFFVFQLNFSLSTATYICSLLASVLSLGLAFSSSVRCLVLMSLPQLFSKRGRQALVAYAFILVFTGPAKNTMRNMRILSETMSCTQGPHEQTCSSCSLIKFGISDTVTSAYIHLLMGKLKEAIKSLVQMIKKPFYAIKDAVQQLKEKIKVIITKMKDLINSIKKTLQSILGVIKTAYDWLNNIVGMCGKKLGTPFERCMKVFDGAIDDCKVQLGSMLNWMCSVAYVASHLCYAVKVFDYVCDLIDFVSDSIVGQVKRKIKEFIYQVRNIFYVRIEFSHSFKFSTEESKSLKEVASGMMTEISQKTSAIFSFFDIMSFGFSFFFLWMVFQILNYRRKFMTNDAFDNRYITDKIFQLDIRRIQIGRETILPLNVHERKKYAPISSIRLVQSERKAITKSTIFLALSTLKLTLQILADYCLYWILTMIRYHGQFKTHLDYPSSVQAKVDGKGMLTELYVSVLNAFQPSKVKLDLDTGACLPDPLPPDFMRYKQIATLMAIAWFICFTEPYGLRLRFVVMSYYNPERASVRAVWLYNNIMRSRGSFLKYARRQLRRKFSKGEDGIEEISIFDRLRARFPIFRKIWKGKEIKMCLLCGSPGSKQSPLIKCPRNNCVGLYCVNCYATLQNLCTICRLPIEYGDLSDISEERDSSEEAVPKENKFKMTESETTEELNLAELIDGTESDLSYGYQYGERDPYEEIQVPLAQKDVEAQKPKDRATINDLPEAGTREVKKYSLTLAERTRSGFWSLLNDSEPTELRRRTLRKTTSELSLPSTIETSYISPEVTTKMKEDVRRSTMTRGSTAPSHSDIVQEKKEHKANMHSSSSSRKRYYDSDLSNYYIDEEKDLSQYDYEDKEFEEDIEEYERSEYSRETEYEDDTKREYEEIDSDDSEYEEIHKRQQSITTDNEESLQMSKTQKSSMLSQEDINKIREKSSIIRSTKVSEISPQRFSLQQRFRDSNSTNQQLYSSRSSSQRLSSQQKPSVYGERVLVNYEGENEVDDYEDTRKITPQLSFPNDENERLLLSKSKKSSYTTRSGLSKDAHYLSGSYRFTSQQPPDLRTERYTDLQGKAGFSILPRESKSLQQKFSGIERSKPTENSQSFSSVRISKKSDPNFTNISILKPSIKSSSVQMSFQERKSSMKQNLVKDRVPYPRLDTFVREVEGKLSPSPKLSKDGTRVFYLNELTADSSNPNFKFGFKSVLNKPEISHPLATYKSQSEVGYIQTKGKRKVSFRTVERKVPFKTVGKSPEMIERWVESGTFHQTYPETSKHQTNFLNRIIKYIFNPFNIFYGKSKNIDSNLLLVPLDNKKEHKNKKRSNILKQNRRNLVKQVPRNEANGNGSWSSSSSIPKIVDVETPVIKTQPKEICLKIDEKTSFKKIVQQPTASQIVYNKFKSN